MVSPWSKVDRRIYYAAKAFKAALHKTIEPDKSATQTTELTSPKDSSDIIGPHPKFNHEQLNRWLYPRGKPDHISRREHKFEASIRTLDIHSIRHLGHELYLRLQDQTRPREERQSNVILLLCMSTGLPITYILKALYERSKNAAIVVGNKVVEHNSKQIKNETVYRQILIKNSEQKAAIQINNRLPTKITQDVKQSDLVETSQTLTFKIPYLLVAVSLANGEIITEKQVREGLIKITKELNLPNCSLGRINTAFEQVILRHTANPIIAAILTGTTLKNRPTINYHVEKVSQLTCYYQEAVREIYPVDISDLNTGRELDSPYFGSQSVPKPDVIAGLFTELSIKISNSSDPIQRLNAHSVWLYFLLLILTAARPVRDLPGEECHIDLEKGIWWQSDKETHEDKSTGRPIPLCPTLCMAIRDYKHHLLNVLLESRFFGAGHQLRLQQYNSNELPLLQVFQGEWMNITPKYADHCLYSIRSLPKYWTRHFSRFWLTSNDCPINIVQALFGHENADDEYFNPLSAGDIPTYSHTIANHMEKLIQKLSITLPNTPFDQT